MDTLGITRIIKELKEHNIEYKFLDGGLMALDKWTNNGELYKKWVNAPNTIERMNEFLGCKKKDYHINNLLKRL